MITYEPSAALLAAKKRTIEHLGRVAAAEIDAVDGSIPQAQHDLIDAAVQHGVGFADDDAEVLVAPVASLVGLINSCNVSPPDWWRGDTAAAKVGWRAIVENMAYLHDEEGTTVVMCTRAQLVKLLRDCGAKVGR